MFIIGKANAEEIAEMKEMGFDVEDVDVPHFDKALDKTLPDDHPDYQPDRYDPDKLVAIFIDCDIVQECRQIHQEEENLQLKKLQYELSAARDKKMDDVWEHYDLRLDTIGFEFADDEGWEHDSRDPDEYCRNFYATPMDDEEADSTKFHFIIRFHPNESRVLETIVRDNNGNDITSGGEE
jgi:hypothetical protein